MVTAVESFDKRICIWIGAKIFLKYHVTGRINISKTSQLGIRKTILVSSKQVLFAD
jgi:hypothetical protein